MAREWEQYIDDVDEEINTSHLTTNQAKKVLKKSSKKLADEVSKRIGVNNATGSCSTFALHLETSDDISLPEVLWQELGMPAQPPAATRITCLAFSSGSDENRRYFRWKFTAAGKAHYLRMQCDVLNVPLLDSLPLLRMFSSRLVDLPMELKREFVTSKIAKLSRSYR